MTEAIVAGRVLLSAPATTPRPPARYPKHHGGAPTWFHCTALATTVYVFSLAPEASSRAGPGRAGRRSSLSNARTCYVANFPPLLAEYKETSTLPQTTLPLLHP